MKSMSDQELAETEAMLRQRLAQLADHAPSAVHLPGEVPVIAIDRPARRGRRAGVIAAVTALVGAGGFTTYSFLGASSDGGAATPQEAVSTFVSAVEHEDLLGMIDVTLPEEVSALRLAVDSVSADAKRLGLLDDQFDLNGVKGVDVSVDDLVLDTNFLEGGLAIVNASSGTINATFDPEAFPFGAKLRALLGDAQHVGTASMTLSQGDPPGLRLMTVQRDGRWYVSLEYTLAEYVRQAVGWDLPGPVTRTPVGFDSPDQAVTGFYERLATLDLQAAFDTFAPGEDAMAWLAQSWIADAQAAIERGRANGWTASISGLTYETIGAGEHLTLKPITFTIVGTAPADFSADSTAIADPSFPTEPTGGPQPFTVELRDGCTSYTGAAAMSLFGDSSSSPHVKPVDGGYQMCGTAAFGALGLFLIGGGTTDVPPVSVVQTGGKWYVSPLGTVLAGVSTSLHDASDGSSLFDSPLALLVYGGITRDYLEAIVIGQPADSVDPACLPALIVDNGTVTGVVADPPFDAVRACNDAGFLSSVSSGAGVEAPLPAETTLTTSP